MWLSKKYFKFYEGNSQLNKIKRILHEHLCSGNFYWRIELWFGEYCLSSWETSSTGSFETIHDTLTHKTTGQIETWILLIIFYILNVIRYTRLCHILISNNKVSRLSESIHWCALSCWPNSRMQWMKLSASEKETCFCQLVRIPLLLASAVCTKCDGDPWLTPSHLTNTARG